MLGIKLDSLHSLNKLSLKRQGYDPFIDFLKGVCIIFVTINHSMPEKIMYYTFFFFWGISAVPIFLLIQVFHAYKKGIDNAKINYRRLWNKIIWPFFLCELIIFIILIIKKQHTHFPQIVSDLLSLIKSGGYGPGAYYPWIYIQFAFLLPFIAPIFRLPRYILCTLFIIISQITESLCSYYGMPQLVYRLLIIRYIFIFYLGFVLAYKGFVLNTFTLFLSSTCLVTTAFIVYSQCVFSPILYTFINPVCHWFCYIYIAYLLLFILKLLYSYLLKSTIFTNFIIKAGRFSYEIFMIQMFYFATTDDSITKFLDNHIESSVLYALSKILIPLIICITPVFIYKKYVNSKHPL